MGVAVQGRERKRGDEVNEFDGNDNHGRPKSEYLAKLSDMKDADLKSECYSMIYQSARCAGNPRADWHWMVDACYAEAKRRAGDIYGDAYSECFEDHAS